MRDDGTMMRSGDMGCPDAMRAANAIWVTGARREGRARALRWLGWMAVVAAVVAVLIVALDVRQADAQSRRGCGDRDTILKALEQRYGEVPAAYAIDHRGAVVEVLVSPEGTWTVIKTPPGQPTCAVDAGESWEFLPIEVGEPS